LAVTAVSVAARNFNLSAAFLISLSEPAVDAGYLSRLPRADRPECEGHEIVMARWGMPSSQRALMDAAKKRAQKLEAKGKPVDCKELLRMEPDGGTANIRNVNSAHWTRWLGTKHRCLVPFTSFSEYDRLRNALGVRQSAGFE
jgi:putative SOS response-associated peptidase YedK